MAEIAGVTTEKNKKGEITHVTIDVEQHKALITPLLEQLGVIEKSDFEREFENAISVEEFKQRSIDFIKTLQWEK